MNGCGFCGRMRSGFTLIEVTLSITLLVVVAAILSGVFYVSRRAVERVQSRVEESEALRGASELLAGYVRSAYPYPVSAEARTVFFAGDARSFSFVSAISRGLGGRGMAGIIVSWSSEAGGDLRLAESMPLRFTQAGGGEGHRSAMVLKRGVRDLRIGYLESRGEDEQWLESWDGAEKRSLPRAVRLDFTDAGGREFRWVFPIMINVLAP